MSRLAAWSMVVCLGCTQSSDYLPVPKLDYPVRLSVAVVSNSAFDPIPRERVERILAEAAREAKATFGLRIVFAPAARIEIEEFFARFDSDSARHALGKLAIDFKRGTGDIRKLADALERDFRNTGFDFSVLHRFAQPYLLAQPQTQDLRGLAGAVAQTHLIRLDRLKGVVTVRGQRAITDEPFNEVAYWFSAGFRPIGFDVVITNQLLASAEYVGAQLHSSLRGGITNGLTSECVDCRYGTYAVLSTYPYWSDDPVVSELRGSRRLDEGEAVRAAALVLVHELGHQLFHYGHPYGQSKCVMSPTPLLEFREWMRLVESKGCVFGSQKALEPGHFVFYDLKNLSSRGVSLLDTRR